VVTELKQAAFVR